MGVIAHLNKNMKMETENEEATLKTDENEGTELELSEKLTSKPPKKGIVYLSTIPPYMDVTRVREYFEEFGKVCRVYLQLGDQKRKEATKKKKEKRKVARKFVEGWVEFERKHIAKKVARLLTNTRVSDRKKSKQYDHIWNIKYLKNFKWTHLHERLAYEKAARRQKLRTEIELAKKKTMSFSANLDKKKKNKEVMNKEYQNLTKENGDIPSGTKESTNTQEHTKDRQKFLSSLF